MPTELFANNPTTTLNGALSAGATTLTVTSSTGFPAAVTGTSQFRVLIDSEILTVTNVSGVTWTVTRGAESTTDTSHLTGAAVTHIVTAAALTNLDASDLANGTVPDARLPSRVSAGGITVTTDWNTITDSGWYSNTTATIPANHPEAGGAFVVMVNGRTSTTTVQVATKTSSNDAMYMRRQSAGVWTAWIQIPTLTDADARYAPIVTRPGSVNNASVTTPGAGFATDTYLVGSSIAVPAGSLQVKSQYRLKFSVSKTNAGTATPIITLRFGTAGSTADASICALTYAAQTAAIDEGLFEIFATFRTVGSGTSAVVQGVGTLVHRLSITGLSTSVGSMVTTTGPGFNSTLASAIIGASVNGGTSAAWTIALVQAELFNLV